MRKINPNNFRVATRGTSREINRLIALNLVRTHQPISRADLARIMSMRRGAVSLIVNDLLSEKLIFEGATGESHRGRKPTFLYINAQAHSVVAVDVRVSRTSLMVTDFIGKQLVATTNFPTEREPARFVADLSKRIKKLMSEHEELGECLGIGVVVPGMVDRATSRVINAPTLGWRDVEILERLAAATGLAVKVENSGKACALAQMWATRSDSSHVGDEVFVSVSDGIGVGVVVNGEVMRGRHNIAGEFGHVPLSIDGPRCPCGATGCWEAYISNLATLSRYFGKDLREVKQEPESAAFTIEDLIFRARSGDAKALSAVKSTARYLGLGMASIVNAIDPGRIYIGGEITSAWDLIEADVRAALSERTLSPDAAKTEIRTVSVNEQPRLRGAAALFTAPAFAAPAVA